MSDCRRHPHPASTFVMVSVPAVPRWVSSNVWASGGPPFTSPLAATGGGAVKRVGGRVPDPAASRKMRVFMTPPIAKMRGERKPGPGPTDARE